MNAYFCQLPGRTHGMSWDPPDPGEYVVPCGIYVAETRGQAKRMLLYDFDRIVEDEDFLEVRTRLLERDVRDAPAGPLGEPSRDWDGVGRPPGPYERLWIRVHEVVDHGGRPCECPVEDVEAA